MPLGLYFQPTAFTKERYDEANRQLAAAGAGFGSVPGRRFHCALEADGMVQVFDVWDSMEQFQAFGEKLVPILNDLGVDPGEPQVSTVLNLQEG
jgi:hypothetical protein